MEKRIFKYRLGVTDKQTLTVPKGARLLSVTEQRGEAVLYAMVHTDTSGHPAPPTEEVAIRIHGTDHPLDNSIDAFTFLGTVQFSGGALMFHVFYSKGGSHE